MILLTRVILAFSILFTALQPPRLGAATMGVRWESMLLPVTIEGQPHKLDALLLYPDDGRRHPLAVISHGSPRDANDRPSLRPSANAEAMLWFAARGYAVVAILRRGYGRSDGGWAESYGSCTNPDYAAAGLRGAADIAAAIAALASNPHVDAAHVLAVGVSAGAFATVALTSTPPPGLTAAIAFAPGRGSYAPDKVCGEDRLVDAFRRYGRTSRVPLLWVSAANDHFFDPPLVKRLTGAFESGGARVTFVAAPRFGSEGHYLFGGDGGIAVWQSSVDAFLSAKAPPPLAHPATLAGPALAAPPMLGPRGRAAFERFLVEPPHKAFAAASDGHYGYAYGARSTADAAAIARSTCAKGTAKPCQVRNLDGGS
jgi:dienelactone hydrolase